MRERAPDRFLVGMRFTMDELVEEGLHEDDAMEIVRLHVDAGLVDFLNVTVGNSFDHAGLSFALRFAFECMGSSCISAGTHRRHMKYRHWDSPPQ